MPPEEFEEVLHFWFPRYLSDDHAAMVRQFEWWFRGGADSAIAERFAPPPERATRGELVRWTRGRAVSGQNTHFQSLQELLAFIAQTLQQNQRTGNTWLLQVEVPQVYPPCHSILSDTQVFLKALPLYLLFCHRAYTPRISEHYRKKKTSQQRKTLEVIRKPF